MSEEHESITTSEVTLPDVELDIPPEPSHVDDLTGHTLAGRYEVERPIGKGGMGLVYLARQSALNRQVVVKVLAKDVCEDEEAITRFEREALGLSQLQHPNIVTIYDFGQDQGMAYIVMEYVDGVTLSSMVHRHGPLNFDDFAHISTQILDALAEAHARGIIHRDIKPSNIMLCTRRGHGNVVKVLDFGLAKIVHDPQQVTKKTNLVGSVAFLAPEQIMGHEFDQRVDVYALGVLFYYMLSGRRPFHGEDDMAVLYQHIHKPPEPLEDVLPEGNQVPPEVISIIHRCLSKNPKNRPEDARAVLEMLQHDMSRSIFRMPWTTGEWAALPGAQVVSPHLQDGVHIDGLATPSSASSIRLPHFDAGDEDSAVSGTYEQPKKSPPLVFIGLMTLAMTLLGLAGVLVFQHRQAQRQRLELQALTTTAPPKPLKTPDPLAAAPIPSEAPASSTLGRLTVDAPVKAKVYVDGAFAGYTPLTIERPPGPTMIEVRAKGHETWTKSVALMVGDPLVLDAALSPKRAPIKTPPPPSKRSPKPPIVKPPAAKPPTAKVAPEVVKKPTPPKNDGLLFKPGGTSKKSGGLWVD